MAKLQAAGRHTKILSGDTGFAETRSSAMKLSYDIVIIGTGAGGGTLAYALRKSGARILLVERGDYLPQEPQNWSHEEVFFKGRYKSAEHWMDEQGRPYSPWVHYWVGGNTKMFGACLPRFRRQVFEGREHSNGDAPPWPIRYEDLEPYYAQAERIYRVHGSAGEDPTGPDRSGDFPYPPVPHAPYVAEHSERLAAQGLHPFHLPMGVDVRDGGRCILCKTCDGFPCQVLAKSDADVCCVRPALESPTVELMTGTTAQRLLTDPAGRHVRAVEVRRNGETFEVAADTFVVSCGAANSAALLLRSADSMHPNGLANGSGLLGRHYMQHVFSALMGIHPIRTNPTEFQKTVGINDFYLKGPGMPYPYGNLALLGKLQAGMLALDQPLVPRPILQAIANRSVDWWAQSEDLPDPENRVTLDASGNVCVRWKPNNLRAHQALVRAAKKMLRAAGFPIILVRGLDRAATAHQCGTMRFGTDPAASVLDLYCRAHDVPNLRVVDASFFPSSAGMDPTLTIAAQALRVGDHMMGERAGPRG
jgi:choline dehydrogenase-like flavoprotein